MPFTALTAPFAALLIALNFRYVPTASTARRFFERCLMRILEAYPNVCERARDMSCAKVEGGAPLPPEHARPRRHARGRPDRRGPPRRPGAARRRARPGRPGRRDAARRAGRRAADPGPVRLRLRPRGRA